MPELPEVENTRRNLVRAGLPGSTIASTNITWANTVKNPSAVELADGLKGRTIQSVERQGKFLILPLSDPPESKVKTPECIALLQSRGHAVQPT